MQTVVVSNRSDLGVGIETQPWDVGRKVLLKSFEELELLVVAED
jgi:hypothetical protein